jgi:hypothetical protein
MCLQLICLFSNSNHLHPFSLAVAKLNQCVEI